MGFVVRGFNSYDVDASSLESALPPAREDEAEFAAQQQFAQEVDINEIVRRFGLTGELPENVRVPQSGDFTGIGDYQSAMQAVRAAQESFMELPAEVRARFSNDPQALMVFMDDPANRDEAVKLGLVNKAEEKTRDEVSPPPAA